MSFRTFLTALSVKVPRVTPAEYSDRIRNGTALLVDVREAKEWEQGFAQSAVLLPLTDLLGSRRIWRPFLETAGKRVLVLYCGAGVRSNLAARLLRAEGARAFNGGSFADWKKADWPIVTAAVANSP